MNTQAFTQVRLRRRWSEPTPARIHYIGRAGITEILTIRRCVVTMILLVLESTRSPAYIDIRARVYRHSPIRLRFRLPKSVTNPACTPSLDHLRPQVLYAMGPFLSRRVLIDITNWAARGAPKGSNHKWATLVSGYLPVVGIVVVLTTSTQ